MMGYTHAIIGATGALAVAALRDNLTSGTFALATVAGVIGGVAVDIDAKDHLKNPKVTDAGRTRLVAAGLVVLILVLNYLLTKVSYLHYFIEHKITTIIGAIILFIVLIIGYLSHHRTFSHSLLFVFISSIGVYCIYTSAAIYYFVGSLLHIVLDMLNYPFNQHGIWLFYPLKTGKGIALKVCKSARIGNKIIYFIGVVLFILLFGYYVNKANKQNEIVTLFVPLIYLIISFHFVRIKSEKEQRCIMHINKEL